MRMDDTQHPVDDSMDKDDEMDDTEMDEPADGDKDDEMTSEGESDDTQ